MGVAAQMTFCKELHTTLTGLYGTAYKIDKKLAEHLCSFEILLQGIEQEESQASDGDEEGQEEDRPQVRIGAHLPPWIPTYRFALLPEPLPYNQLLLGMQTTQIGDALTQQLEDDINYDATYTATEILLEMTKGIGVFINSWKRLVEARHDGHMLDELLDTEDVSKLASYKLRKMSRQLIHITEGLHRVAEHGVKGIERAIKLAEDRAVGSVLRNVWTRDGGNDPRLGGSWLATTEKLDEHVSGFVEGIEDIEEYTAGEDMAMSDAEADGDEDDKDASSSSSSSSIDAEEDEDEDKQKNKAAEKPKRRKQKKMAGAKMRRIGMKGPHQVEQDDADGDNEHRYDLYNFLMNLHEAGHISDAVIDALLMKTARKIARRATAEADPTGYDAAHFKSRMDMVRYLMIVRLLDRVVQRTLGDTDGQTLRQHLNKLKGVNALHAPIAAKVDWQSHYVAPVAL